MSQRISGENLEPALTVVIPIYNGENFIEETLASVRGQTFENFELICVDDGSMDRTPSILQKLAAADNRISIIRKPNGGPGAARNTGLDAATGKFVIMLDADDIYEPNMFETMLAKASNSEADVVACRSALFDDATGEELDSTWVIKNDQLPKKDSFSPVEIKDFIFTAFMGWPWDKLYRRSFIEREGLRFPNLNNSEDLYFVFLSLAKASTISVIDEPLIRHRMNRSGSVSTSRKFAPLDFYKSICEFKNALKTDPIGWANYSWSFFNWALEYLVWNISTMTDPEARNIQLKALIEGELSELELSKHAASYFSLCPENYNQYLELLKEAYGIERGQSQARRSLANHMASFFSRVDQDGLGVALSAFLNYRVRGNSQEPANAPKLPNRGAAYTIVERSRLVQPKDENGGSK